jgi:hypothetical protein
MRLRAIIIAALASAFGGLTLSLAISLAAFLMSGSPDARYRLWRCQPCALSGADTPDRPELEGSPCFDQMGVLCTPQDAEVHREAVIQRYLWHVERQDLGAVKSYMAARSAFYRAELLLFEFESGGQRTKRFVSAWGFPRPLLLLESPWPADRKFRDFEAQAFRESLDAKLETGVKARVLWGGVLPSIALFGLPIWCVWVVWTRSVPRTAAFLWSAFTGALLLTVGVAWSAGSVRVGVRSDLYSDPALYPAASPVERPLEGTWDAFIGSRERSWTHISERWRFSRVTLHETGVHIHCPIREHLWEGCGFPFVAFASDYPSPLGPARTRHEPSRIGEHAAPFDVAGLSPVWPGLLANLAFWFAVIVVCAKGPSSIRGAARARRGACRGCGHLLAGLQRCPECGVDTPKPARP